MHTIHLRALMVEDSEDDMLLIQRELVQGDFDLELERVETAPAMQAALERQTWDVVLVDYSVPGFGAVPALALLQATGLDIPFIVISGTIGEETAVAMMRAGAADYVMKDRLNRLVPAIRRELQDAITRREHRVAEAALQAQEREKTAMEVRFRDFMRDVLAAVTEGKLNLCYTDEDLPAAVSKNCELVPLPSLEALRTLRQSSQAAAKRIGFDDSRWQDLITAVSEAGMNAIVHGGGGNGHVCQGNDTVQVWIEDHGDGIAVERLPRATLEKGYTTAGSLGLGMKMMLQATDRLWLLTGLSGTTIVLEQGRHQALPSWMD
jgi:anti-sigma regulatory factor (Ser/Thr protein kinase)/DNA-binding NarL/FixJ family response regulator